MAAGVAAMRQVPGSVAVSRSQMWSNGSLGIHHPCADYTIRGMEGEIADYQNVITKMTEKLESMSDEELNEVEEASKILRRLRAGATVSGPVALPMPVVRPAGEVGR